MSKTDDAKHVADLIGKAKTALQAQGAVDPDRLFALAEELKQADLFTYARRVLERARAEGGEFTQKLIQRLALCTYKDRDLPTIARLDEARKILQQRWPTQEENDEFEELTETQALLGAIHKRLFEATARTEHLERSFEHYTRAYGDDVGTDAGYPAVNAAFMLDLLADAELQAHRRAAGGDGPPPPSACRYRDQARELRLELSASMKDQHQANPEETDENEWFLVTLGEACFGLGLYDEAKDWFARANEKSAKKAAWQRETSARQLATLAQVRERLSLPEQEPDQKAWEALEVLMGGSAAGVVTARFGKVGLALSGGGFRASLYHLGVLARLAELDVLRHVEVISCVSGGSIVGAHYYLELRKRLSEQPEAELTTAAYVELVEKVIETFMAGVQKNLRMLAFIDPRRNWEMLVKPGYSRTNRLGELYEEEIYARLEDPPTEAPELVLADLKTTPYAEDADSFNPKQANWERTAKVPNLVLNATTMNTGHNWQFTASFMGEPPFRDEVDGNYRLRRMYHAQAPPGYRRTRLGTAVAASSCVPMLFDPIELRDLYKDKVVQLVDGGVHDNQGVASLLEQDCSVILASDASGQSESSDAPSTELPSVLGKMNSTFMGRVREAQYIDLATRRRMGILKGLTFVHLKMDLPVIQIDWRDCDDPKEDRDRKGVEDVAARTPYGIAMEIQELIAASRTDLDAFSNLEARAIMASGYRMTEHYFEEFRGALAPAPKDAVKPARGWVFEPVSRMLEQPRGSLSYERLKRTLEIGRGLTGKVLAGLGGGVQTVMSVAAIAGLAIVLFTYPQLLRFALYAAAAYGATSVIAWIALRGRNKSFVQVAVNLFMATAGWAFVWAYLKWLNPLYLKQGKVDEDLVPRT